MDHGSEFGVHRVNEGGSRVVNLKKKIESLKLNQYLQGQTSSDKRKVEKRFDTYKGLGEFESFEELIENSKT
jgi:putative transposase